MRNLGPVDALHRAVEFRQRIHHDLAQRRLNGAFVLRRIVLEDARNDEAGVGRRAEHLGDAPGRLALPVGTDQQVEAGLGVVHLAELHETVGAQVDRLVDPEAIAEIRHLHHHRRDVERQHAQAIDHVRVGAGDLPFGRIDIVGEHAQAIDRRRNRRTRTHHLGELRDGEPAVVDIDHRPCPEIGIARDQGGVVVGDLHADVGPRHGRGRRRHGLRGWRCRRLRQRWQRCQASGADQHGSKDGIHGLFLSIESGDQVSKLRDSELCADVMSSCKTSAYSRRR